MCREKHFRHVRWFCCPECHTPLVAQQCFEDFLKSDQNHCTHCGKEIASALAEALAELEELKKPRKPGQIKIDWEGINKAFDELERIKREGRLSDYASGSFTQS